MPFWREFTTRVVAGLAGAGTAGVRAAEEEAAPGAAEEEAAPGAVAAEAALAAFALVVAMRGMEGTGEPRRATHRVSRRQEIGPIAWTALKT